MNILFDVFVKVPELRQAYNLKEREVFNAMIMYLEQRLSSLKEEMEAEEVEKFMVNSSCYIMIHLMPPTEQWNLPKEKQDKSIRITANGYNKSLRNKIDAALNNQDLVFLNQKINKVVSRF